MVRRAAVSSQLRSEFENRRFVLDHLKVAAAKSPDGVLEDVCALKP